MKKVLIYNAKLVPMITPEIPCGFLTFAQGIIQTMGDMEHCPAKQAFDICIDANGGWLLPGLIDAHTHLGLYEDSIGFEGADGNEDTDPVTPQMRVIDGINPRERAFEETRKAGVTCCAVSPGSANPIGGQIAIIKTNGNCIDRMIVKEPAAIKFALGENPKSAYHEKDQSPVTRMATAAILRETLKKAQEYDSRCKRATSEEDLPDYEIKYEALRPLLHGEIPAHIHAHRADDIFTAIRICREFGIRPVVVHATEGHEIAYELAQAGIPVLSGPFLTDRSKPELRGLTEQSPGILSKTGVSLAITTDHPETPVKYLRHCARIATENGMDEMEALRAITCYPAEILGVSDTIGGLRVGMQADLVLFSNHPFAYQSQVCMTICDGHIVYQAPTKKE